MTKANINPTKTTIWMHTFLWEGTFQWSKCWIACEEIWAWVPVFTEALYMILSKALRVGLSCLNKGLWYHLRCLRVSNTSVQGWPIQNRTLRQQLEARKDLDTCTASCTAFCMCAGDLHVAFTSLATSRLVLLLLTFPEPRCPVSPAIRYSSHRITATRWPSLEGTSGGHLVQHPAQAGTPRAGCPHKWLWKRIFEFLSACNSLLFCLLRVKSLKLDML